LADESRLKNYSLRHPADRFPLVFGVAKIGRGLLYFQKPSDLFFITPLQCIDFQ
jgi:hypothetical protein